MKPKCLPSDPGQSHFVVSELRESMSAENGVYFGKCLGIGHGFEMHPSALLNPIEMMVASTGMYAEAQKKRSSAACIHERVEGCESTADLGFLI